MIVTCKKEIPARWLLVSILPWASYTYTWSVIGVAFLFSLKKFVDNPAGLTFVLSLPSFISMVLGPSISLISDRIWTRFGRRKPFLVTSWIGIVTCLSLMPMMTNFWALVGVYMIFFIFTDLSTPLEPLKQEIIPPHERGRATGAMQWCANIGGIIFYFLALGRFDDVAFMAGMPFVGEKAIYGSAAIMLSVMLLLIMLGIKEVDQKSKLVGQRFSLKSFFGALLDHELWPVYMLVLGWSTVSAGLGALGNLLYTDQWSYTKQDMGINIAIGGVLNMFIIGLLAIFADKLNRLKAYRTLICISVALNFSYFCYVTFVLPNQRPSLVEIIIFGETGSIVSILSNMVYVPLVYDYIRRNKMGAYVAGASLVSRLTGLLTLNGIGLFIWAYALFFQPPAGEMTCVTLRDKASQKTEVQAALRAANTWTYPQDNSPAPLNGIVVNAWQANGTVSDTGRSWEIRLRNKDSEKLAEQKSELSKDLSRAISEEKLLRDTALAQTSKAHSEKATEAMKSAEAKKALVTELNQKVAAIDAKLAERAGKFREEVVKVLGSRLIADGDQVLGVSIREAVVVEIPTIKRPDVHRIEKDLDVLRQQLPNLIDLRPMKRESGYSIAISALLKPGSDPSLLARELQEALERSAINKTRDLISPGAVPLSISRQPALSMDLMIVEDPLETYVSPITRVVNLALRFYDAAPSPERKLSAIARNLRTPSDINHIRVNAGQAPKTITVIAILPDNAPKAAITSDSITVKMESCLGTKNTPLPEARAFYDRIEKSAALQRISVARPFLRTGYTAIKYNYMAGYIWMFILGLIGITVTTLFARFESKGFIHKRGIEETRES